MKLDRMGIARFSFTVGVAACSEAATKNGGDSGDTPPEAAVEAGPNDAGPGNAGSGDSGIDANVAKGTAQISVGGDHSCALSAQGKVRCWGFNGFGQLGYGHTTNIGDDETPASAGDVSVGGTVTQLALGFNHTCALLTSGKVRCWGDNKRGQLGYGNTNAVGDDEKPDTAGDVDLGGNAIQIAAGDEHTCALLSTGSVRCWGNNWNGQLGYGHTKVIGDDEKPSSASVVDLGSGTVTQIALGAYHSCALLSTGSVRCWGSGFWGTLGYGNRNAVGDDEAPVTAGDVKLGAPATRIAAGGWVTCAQISGGIMCWGSNDRGQLGMPEYDSIGDDETPSEAGKVKIPDVTVDDISVGEKFVCVRLTDGKVRCWGNNGYGQLGLGSKSQQSSASSSTELDVGFSVAHASAGWLHACAISVAGDVKCWGVASSGQLGYANTESIGDDEKPSSVGNVAVW